MFFDTKSFAARLQERIHDISKLDWVDEEFLQHAGNFIPKPLKKILKEIENLSNRYGKIIQNPLFCFLSLKDYVRFFPEIFKMHEEDLKMKQSIFNDISQQQDSEILIIYISAWIMSPKIELVLNNITGLGEGPHWDDGTQQLYFVDIFQQNIHRYDPKTKEHKIVHIEGGPVSIVIPMKNKKDTFVITRGRDICEMKWNGQSTTPETVTKLGEVQKDVPENRINDGKCDSSGRLWCGTMGPEKSAVTFLEEVGEFVSFGFPKKVVEKHFGKVTVSNGMAWNKEDTVMYFEDSITGLVEAFDFDLKNGKISNRRAVFDMAANKETGFPDGMTIDTNGNLWVAIYNGNKVLHIDPRTKKLLGKIELPAKYITSVCWGGPNLDVLYVTSANRGAATNEDQKPGSLFQVTGTGCKGYPAFNFTC